MDFKEILGSPAFKKVLIKSLKLKTIQKLKEYKQEFVHTNFLKESVEDELNSIISNGQNSAVVLDNNESIEVDVKTADMLLTLLNALEDENKQKMTELLSSSAVNFMKVVDFAMENLNEPEPTEE